MLVTLSRWLVMFGLDCEKACRPRQAEGSGGQWACRRLRHLGERKQAGEGGLNAGRNSQRGMFLYNRCTMLRTATLSVMFHVFFEKLFLSQGSASASRIHLTPAVFVLGLTWADTANWAQLAWKEAPHMGAFKFCWLRRIHSCYSTVLRKDSVI